MVWTIQIQLVKDGCVCIYRLMAVYCQSVTILDVFAVSLEVSFSDGVHYSMWQLL